MANTVSIRNRFTPGSERHAHQAIKILSSLLGHKWSYFAFDNGQEWSFRATLQIDGENSNNEIEVGPSKSDQGYTATIRHTEYEGTCDGPDPKMIVLRLLNSLNWKIEALETLSQRLLHLLEE